METDVKWGRRDGNKWADDDDRSGMGFTQAGDLSKKNVNGYESGKDEKLERLSRIANKLHR